MSANTHRRVDSWTTHRSGDLAWLVQNAWPPRTRTAALAKHRHWWWFPGRLELDPVRMFRSPANRGSGRPFEL